MQLGEFKTAYNPHPTTMTCLEEAWQSMASIPLTSAYCLRLLYTGFVSTTSAQKLGRRRMVPSPKHDGTTPFHLSGHEYAFFNGVPRWPYPRSQGTEWGAHRLLTFVASSTIYGYGSDRIPTDRRWFEGTSHECPLETTYRIGSE